MKKLYNLFIIVLCLTLIGCSKNNSNNIEEKEALSSIEIATVEYLVAIANDCYLDIFDQNKCIDNPHSIKLYKVWAYDANSAGYSGIGHPYKFAFSLLLKNKYGGEEEIICGTEYYNAYYDNERGILFRVGGGSGPDKLSDKPLLSGDKYWNCEKGTNLAAIVYGKELNAEKIFDEYLKLLDK